MNFKMTKFARLFLGLLLLFMIFLMVTFTLGFINKADDIIPQIYRLMFLICIYLSGIICAFFTYYTNRILNFIDNSEPFSIQVLDDVKRVRNIFLYEFLVLLGAVPLIYANAQIGDAPGLLIISGAIILVPLVLSVFIGILYELLKKVIMIKEDSELTI
jgi:Protein of unknown function (DUF3036).